MPGERSSHDCPINACDSVNPKFHHDAAEENADGRGGDGMSVGEPEVKRKDRGLDVEAYEDEDEGSDDKRIRLLRECASDLRHVECAGPRVEHGDTAENEEGPDRVS